MEGVKAVVSLSRGPNEVIEQVDKLSEWRGNETRRRECYPAEVGNKWVLYVAFQRYTGMSEKGI